MAGKKIIPGRKLVVSEMPQSVLQPLQAQGWIHFLTRDAPTHDEVVEEFYTNLKWEDNVIDKMFLYSTVFGQEIRFNEKLIGSLFKLKRVGVDAYSKNEWLPRETFDHVACLRFLNEVEEEEPLSSSGALERPLKSKLKGDWMVLSRIIKENLLPTINRDKALGIMECQLLYLMLKEQPVNLPALIIKHMAASKNRNHLPYGMILTYILHHFKLLSKPMQNFALLLDEKAMLHQKVYLVHGTFYNAAEFLQLPLSTQNEYRRQHNLPAVSGEEEPALKRSRSAHAEVPRPPQNDDVVDKIKHYLRHKLIKPMKKQLGKIKRQLTDIQQRQERLERKFDERDEERTHTASRHSFHGGEASSHQMPRQREGKGIAVETSTDDSDWDEPRIPRTGGKLHINEPQESDSNSS